LGHSKKYTFFVALFVCGAFNAPDMTLKTLFALQAALIVLPMTAWGFNLYHLCHCDFKPSYKGEVIHAVGVFSPTCLFTAWKNFD
jgi:hypothetical protein